MQYYRPNHSLPTDTILKVSLLFIEDYAITSFSTIDSTERYHTQQELNVHIQPPCMAIPIGSYVAWTNPIKK